MFYKCSQTYNDIPIIKVSIISLDRNYSVYYLITSLHPRPGQLYWILYTCLYLCWMSHSLAFWWMYCFCIPMRTKWHFPLCSILVHVWWHQRLHLSCSDKPASSLDLIAFICSFLITCDIEYLFMCLFSLCVSIVWYIAAYHFVYIKILGCSFSYWFLRFLCILWMSLLTNFFFVNVL